MFLEKIIPKDKKLFLGIKSGGLLYFGLIDYVYNYTYSIKELKVYQSIGESTGEINLVYLVPRKNRLVIMRKYDSLFEYAIFSIKGTNLTHYFGSLYNSGESIFSLRIYNDVDKAYKCEIKLINKTGNISESTFNEIGDVIITDMIFRSNSLELGGGIYTEIDVTQLEIEFINSIEE